MVMGHVLHTNTVPRLEVMWTNSWSSSGRRLFDEDFPLEVVLEANFAHRNSKLVLRDNTYHTIQWDAFTAPELSNFILMLQREEEIYASKVWGLGVWSGD